LSPDTTVRRCEDNAIVTYGYKDFLPKRNAVKIYGGGQLSFLPLDSITGSQDHAGTPRGDELAISEGDTLERAHLIFIPSTWYA
jgi:hypothetical protein